MGPRTRAVCLAVAKGQLRRVEARHRVVVLDTIDPTLKGPEGVQIFDLTDSATLREIAFWTDMVTRYTEEQPA